MLASKLRRGIGALCAWSRTSQKGVGIVLASSLAAIVLSLFLGDAPNKTVLEVETRMEVEAISELGKMPGSEQTKVSFETCYTPNAFWNNGQIVICHEYVEKAIQFDPKRAHLVHQFTLLHEWGHAATAAGLVFVGNEELAADEFAAVLLILAGKEDVVQAKIDFWRWEVKQNPSDGIDSLSSHMSSARRAAHVECLLRKSRGLPSRACNYEPWGDTVLRWSKLFALLGRPNMV